MTESYTVIFSSRGTNNNGVANLNSITYFVNWGAFLPQQYKKFSVEFIFKSENFVGNLTDNGFVNMNIGRLQVYDGVAMSSNIGIVYPVSLVGNTSFYNSTNNDNNAFIIDYPNNQNITISLKNFAGANMANMPNYALVLNLVPLHNE